MHLVFKTAVIVVAGISISACEEKPVVPEKLAYQIVSVKPHDPEAFTQGFQLVGSRLFESTGREGFSSVREVDPKTGAVLRKRSLPSDVFGEGLTVHGDKAWVLTWTSKTAYVLDRETFRTLKTLTYSGEGWGLTNDGKQLIMSDGTSTLRFRNFEDFSVTRSVEVTDQGRPIKFLNELEYINGEIFANVFTTTRIARIDPKTGQVTGWLDLSALRGRLSTPNRADVLNGIAFDGSTGHLWVTGKNWPQMFEIKLQEK